MDDTLLSSDHSVREVRPHIFSVRGREIESVPYDSRAAAYDRVVGSRLYNRIVWGVSLKSYGTFVRRALGDGEGGLLDAGAGSAVFTADAYAETSRSLILVDRSLGMLEAARDRITAQAGGTFPETITLLQTDAMDLPLRAESIETVLSMGLFHLIEEIEACVDELFRVLAPEGALFATSLVSDRALGRHYLRFLHAVGELAAPRTERELRLRIVNALDRPVSTHREGNMAFVQVEKAEGATQNADEEV